MKTTTLWDDATAEERARILQRIQRVCELVAEVRSVPVLKLFSPHREREDIASARSMAMALCVAVRIEKCHVARAFMRNWRTVHTSVWMAEYRYRNSQAFRAEWDRIKADEAFKA